MLGAEPVQHSTHKERKEKREEDRKDKVGNRYQNPQKTTFSFIDFAKGWFHKLDFLFFLCLFTHWRRTTIIIRITSCWHGGRPIL